MPRKPGFVGRWFPALTTHLRKKSFFCLLGSCSLSLRQHPPEPCAIAIAFPVKPRTPWEFIICFCFERTSMGSFRIRRNSVEFFFPTLKIPATASFHKSPRDGEGRRGRSRLRLEVCRSLHYHALPCSVHPFPLGDAVFPLGHRVTLVVPVLVSTDASFHHFSADLW